MGMACRIWPRTQTATICPRSCMSTPSTRTVTPKTEVSKGMARLSWIIVKRPIACSASSEQSTVASSIIASSPAVSLALIFTFPILALRPGKARPLYPLGVPSRTTAKARPRPTLGTDLWREIAGRRWSYWDLWFALVCWVDHACDWDSLGAALELRGHFWERDTEAKRSHMDDLARRLATAGLDLERLAGSVFEEQPLRLKARTKVLHRELMARDRSEAMVHTPRVRLRERALRGRWEKFPLSPMGFWKEFADEVGERPFYGERAAMHLADRLEKALTAFELGSGAEVVQRLALCRALLTAGYEAQARANDSSGDLGRLLQKAWQAYAGIPWSQSGIEAEPYYRDLCDLVVWDEFSSLYEIEEVPFRAVAADDVGLVDEILNGLASELAGARLRYQAGRAQEARAWLHIAKGELEGFVKTAGELGSDSWVPIERMARAAVERGRPEIAEAVYAAADQPGFSREYLRERRKQILGMFRRPLRPRLTVVD